MAQFTMVSLDFWEMLNTLVLDEEKEIAWRDPNSRLTLDYDVYDSRDRARYARHQFYYDTRIRYTTFASVILGVTCLETYANELTYLCSNIPEYRKQELYKLGVRRKYHGLSEELCGHRFDEEADPFQSFSLLVEVRNELIHFRRRRVEKDSEKMKRPNRPFWVTKFEKILETDKGFIFPDDLVGVDVPEWVKDIVGSMIRAINAVVNDTNICFNPTESVYRAAKRREEGDG